MAGPAPDTPPGYIFCCHFGNLAGLLLIRFRLKVLKFSGVDTIPGRRRAAASIQETGKKRRRADAAIVYFLSSF